MTKRFRKSWVFVLGCIMAFVLCSSIQHALKLSTTTITVEKGQLVFRTRLFADDLSECMRQYIHKPFPLEGETISPEKCKAIEGYFVERFSVKVNSTLCNLQFQNITVDFSDPDVKVIVVEGHVKGKFQAKNISKLSIKNILMFDHAPEQKNIVNIQQIKPENKVLMFNYNQDLGYLEVGL